MFRVFPVVSAPLLLLALQILLISHLLFFPNAAEAKLFRNSYISFELPSKWECTLNETEWVCRNTDTSGQKDKEAIIILTAKQVGPSDSIAAYESFLKMARTLPSTQGTPIRSQVKSVMHKQISGHVWIDGMHLSSEVRDYYTRYLATVKDQIAIVVTFSAHMQHYTKYSGDFFRSVESLNILGTRALLNNSQAMASVRPGAETLGANIQTAMPTGFGDDLPEEGSSSGGNSTTSIILALAIILGAGGAYLMLKGKDKGKGKKFR